MKEKRKYERMLTPQEVAECFNVDPKTVSRWARNGILPAVRTPGGHHRFRESEVEPYLVSGLPVEAEEREVESGEGGDARA